MRDAPHKEFSSHICRIRARNFRVDLWSTDGRSRFPAPERAEAGAVPGDHCLRLNNCDRGQEGWKQSIEAKEQRPVGPTQPHSLGPPAPQDTELMP